MIVGLVARITTCTYSARHNYQGVMHAYPNGGL